MSGLFAWIFLSVWMSKSHKVVAFLFSMTFGGLCSHQLISCDKPKFLHKHQWMNWPRLSCRFRYSVGASMGQPDTSWSMVSLHLSHTLYFESAPFSNIFAWKFLVGRLWTYATLMKPSVSDFRPDEASHGWVSEKFTSGSLARIGNLLRRGLSFYPSFSSLMFLVFACVLICFAFSVDKEFSEMLSVLRLISFKYFFALLIIKYMHLFCSARASSHLFYLNKCPFQ